MKFFFLSSDQQNCSRDLNTFTWCLSNLDLGKYNNVALSQIAIDFNENFSPEEEITQVYSNLIDRSVFNPNGVIHVIPTTTSYSMSTGNLQFWPFDCVKSRDFITFTFHHTKANIVKNLHVTLAFANSENEAQTLVRFNKLSLKCVS